MVGITSSLIVALLKMLLYAREQEPTNGFKSYTRLYEFISEPGTYHPTSANNVCIVDNHPVVIPAKIAAHVAENDRFMRQSLANASLAAVPSADKDWYDVVAAPRRRRAARQGSKRPSSYTASPARHGRPSSPSAPQPPSSPKRRASTSLQCFRRPICKCALCARPC